MYRQKSRKMQVQMKPEYLSFLHLLYSLSQLLWSIQPKASIQALTRLMKECYTTTAESRPSLRNVLTAVNKAFSTS